MKRIILGDRSGGHGFWVSRPGRPATSLDPDDFSLMMTAETPQAVKAGVITDFSTVIGTIGGQTARGAYVYHNLGYKPMFMWSAKMFSSGAGSNVHYMDQFGILFGQTEIVYMGPQYMLVATTMDQGLVTIPPFTYIIFRTKIA